MLQFLTNTFPNDGNRFGADKPSYSFRATANSTGNSLNTVAKLVTMITGLGAVQVQ